MNFNKVMLGGNMTRDPELRQIPSGTALCEFGMAVNRRFKTAAGEEKEEVLFVDCTAWGRTAEVISEHFAKGKPIFVEGRLHYETWEDKSGGKRSKLTINVDNFQFVGNKNDGDGGYRGEAEDKPTQQLRQSARTAAKASVARQSHGPMIEGEDEIPFDPAPSRQQASRRRY